MYFKKLELSGFKSFPNRTILHFEPGLTSIVGPNGCGKSNIFDAIRWVLGEQSVKALRGLRMEDVIFNGTETKEPLGLAEVSLTLSNTNKIFPIDDKEFVITRRIFRSGESEYLINRSGVRLKDISELFMGTGVGAESYSLVEQGKIDLILSSRPEDRRLVFDEASGITKYKAQKKEALRKLEETEGNLLRLNDIINEVRRQINSLERQANKARRYKEIFEELKRKEIDLAIFQLNKIEKEKSSQQTQNKKLESSLEKTEEECRKTLAQQEKKNSEFKQLQDGVHEIRESILNFDNLIERNKQHISINQERIQELEKQKEILDKEIIQISRKITEDKKKLDDFNQEYQNLNGHIQDKQDNLQENEDGLKKTLGLIKKNQDKIIQAKKDTFELLNLQTKIKNEIIDLTAKIQSSMARERRLKIEKSKVNEEKDNIQEVLSRVEEELSQKKLAFEDKNNQYLKVKQKIETDTNDVDNLRGEIQDLEKQRAGLISQKEFLDNLNIKFKQIHESMNAVVLLDKEPKDDVSGLVVKIDKKIPPEKINRGALKSSQFKLTGEAKPIALDTQGLQHKIDEITTRINLKKESVFNKERELNQLKLKFKELEKELREQEIALANKKSQFDNINEQLNKINEELEIVELELSQTTEELKELKQKESQLMLRQSDLEKELKVKEKIITDGQDEISTLNSRKEETLILIAQIRTELDSLNKRLVREDDTLKMLGAALKSDEDRFLLSKSQIEESEEKIKTLNSEIKNLQKHNEKTAIDKEKTQDTQLRSAENLKQMQEELGGYGQNLETERQRIQKLKDELNQIHLQIQERDFRLQNIKDRIMQSYKTDLDNITTTHESLDEEAVSLGVKAIKEKLDAYGGVNLVAIEEYNELKARYDFLNQQQNDLITGKDSLHEAISKINRTTRKKFQETFKKISEEFSNFFRLLFGGGDAKLFLIDESDPLESGIEIICRPPGKKLQNVSILSGGEKALSAIALIFAIFRVKPSPFCILDEVDAALDEANVDRYTRLLQEFTKSSQFIVITHNKRTIVNADAMYGITMEEQGVSKIISVKFSQDKPSRSQTSKEKELVSA